MDVSSHRLSPEEHEEILRANLRRMAVPSSDSAVKAGTALYLELRRYWDENGITVAYKETDQWEMRQFIMIPDSIVRLPHPEDDSIIIDQYARHKLLKKSTTTETRGKGSSSMFGDWWVVYEHRDKYGFTTPTGKHPKYVDEILDTEDNINLEFSAIEDLDTVSEISSSMFRGLFGSHLEQSIDEGYVVVAPPIAVDIFDNEVKMLYDFGQDIPIELLARIYAERAVFDIPGLLDDGYPAESLPGTGMSMIDFFGVYSKVCLDKLSSWITI
jgi:hypothetical protein